MSNLHNERYDEIKSLLKKSKFLMEQTNPKSQINVGKDIEAKIDSDQEDYELGIDDEEDMEP